METARYHNLRTLLQWDRAKAKKTLLQLQEDSKQVVAHIEEEMIRLHGFKWKIWLGFHALPSMDHIHLHIVSSDLCSSFLSNKERYNGFHPKTGIFLHLHKVLRWFERKDSYYTRVVSQLSGRRYGPLLRKKMICWKCSADWEDFPTFKAHLQEEWDEEKRRAVSQKNQEEEAAANTLDETNTELDRQNKQQSRLDNMSTSPA